MEKSIIIPKKISLYFDGACTKNPGGIASFGFIIYCKQTNQLIHQDSGEVCRNKQASCNIAEWAALRNGLRYLEENNWTGDLEIFGDSQLVIFQLNGKYKVKKDTLIPYWKECLGFLKKWQWSASWVPRDKNKECDALSKFVPKIE